MQIQISSLKKGFVVILVIIGVLCFGFWYQSLPETPTPVVKEPTMTDLSAAEPSAKGPIAEIVRNPQIGQSVTVTGKISTFPDGNSFALTENNASIVVRKQKADDTLQVGDSISVTGKIVKDGDLTYIESDSITVTNPTPTPASTDPTPIPTRTSTVINNDPTPTPAFTLNEEQVRQVALQHIENSTIVSVKKLDDAGTRWEANLRLPDSTQVDLIIAVQGQVITINEI